MQRLYENRIREDLGMFPCVTLVGPRQCGKSTLLKTLGPDWKIFDLERRADLEQIQQDPDLFFRLYPDKVAIDEAQILPELFPALRVAIDAQRQRRGRFVLTGSSSPELLHSISESLAGRVATIEMSPFLWAEVEGGEVSDFLKALVSGETATETLLASLSPRAGVAAAHDYWLRGGYPDPWLQNDTAFTDRWTDQYIQTYLYRDIGRLFPGLNAQRFRNFIQLLGGLSGQIINYAEVARTLGVSQPTAKDYFQIAHGTFLWRNLPAFDRKTSKRIVKHPRGFLRDTGLLHQLAHIRSLEQLMSHPQTGMSWEGLVIEEILRQFQIIGVNVEASFFRTGTGAEVDLVCEGHFGILPFEIKRGNRIDKRNLRALMDFVEEQGCPVGIVINNDEVPRQYTEKIIGVPFVTL